MYHTINATTQVRLKNGRKFKLLSVCTRVPADELLKQDKKKKMERFEMSKVRKNGKKEESKVTYICPRRH